MKKLKQILQLEMKTLFFHLNDFVLHENIVKYKKGNH